MSTSDKFPMHDEFPMDEVYLQKARDRGQHEALARDNFKRWRSFWKNTGQKRTPRGWLKCWDNDCIKRARWAAGVAQQKAEPEKRIPAQRQQVAVGGRIYSFSDILTIRRKQSLRQALDTDEQQALEAWNG